MSTSPDLHDQLLFVAETVGQISERLDKIESENLAAGKSVDASLATVKAAGESLTAALQGIKALDSHVLSNSLGAVSRRVEDQAKQFEQEIKRVESMHGDLLKRQEQSFSRVEMSAKQESQDRQEFARKSLQKFEELRGEITQLSERLAAAEKTFTDPIPFNPKGKWQSNSTYNRLDVVEYNGSSYIAMEGKNKDIPSTRDCKKWMLLARRAAGAANVALSEAELQDIWKTGNTVGNLSNVTSLTGGGANSLDGITTTLGAVTTGATVITTISGSPQTWQLVLGTDAEDGSLVVRPDDYDAGSNARVWKLQY